jgi:hypothetical protein
MQRSPCLFGLFSIVTLLAGQLNHQARTAVWTDSWYRKSYPTVADALAAVRRQIWRERVYSRPGAGTKRQNPHRPFSDA